MKKFLSLILALTMALSLVACGGSNEAPADNGAEVPADAAVEPIELVYANAYAATHPQVGLLADEWAEAIKEATDGRVTIRCIHGGALLAGADMLSGIQNQVADCGSIVISLFPGEFPIASEMGGTVDLALGDKLDLKGVQAITMKMYEEFPELEAEYTNAGVKKLFTVATPDQFIISNKKVASFEDLGGLKIRPPAQNFAVLMEAAGCTAVNVASNEVYTSIQTNVINGNFTDAPNIVSSKFDEVGKYAIQFGEGGASLPVFSRIAYIINEDSFAKLSPEDQQIFVEVSEKFNAIGAERMTEAGVTAYEQMKADGVEFCVLSDEDLAKWDAACPDWQAKWAENLNALGLPGDAISAKFIELATAYADGSWVPEL